MTLLRIVQIGLLALGVAFFIGAGACAPAVEGLVFWRAGVALLLVDIVLLLLWPTGFRPPDGRQDGKPPPPSSPSSPPPLPPEEP